MAALVEKRCYTCGETKPRTAFAYHINRGGDGMSGACRVCQAKASQARRDLLSSREVLPDPPYQKKCSDCKEVKPGTEFHRRRATFDGLTPICKACNCARVNKWRTEDPERYQNSKLQSTYGISLAEYKEMEAAQNGRCMVCGEAPDGGFVVDHCHSTGKVRALLCKFCNIGLGCFFDRTDVLANAVEYIKKYRCSDE